MLTLDTFRGFRQSHQDASLYATAYRYNNSDIRSADMIGDLYIDFDVDDIAGRFEHLRNDIFRTMAALKALFGIEQDSVQLYFSGGKGFHITIPSEVLGIQPNPELNMIFKHIAEDLSKLIQHDTIDTRIYDKVRLLRVPNSIHQSTGLYKVPITLSELRDGNLESLSAIASQPRRPIPVKRTYSTKANQMYQKYIREWEKEKKAIESRRNKYKDKTLNFMPPCIQHILEEGAQKGKRNNTAAALASYFLQRGVSESEALDRVNEWNEMHCVPSLPGREVQTTVQSIYRSEHKFGCRTLKEISICSSSCKMYKDDGRKQLV